MWHVASDRPFQIVPDSFRYVIAGDDAIVLSFRFRGTGMSDVPQVRGGRSYTMLVLDGAKIARQWYSEMDTEPAR